MEGILGLLETRSVNKSAQTETAFPFNTEAEEFEYNLEQYLAEFSEASALKLEQDNKRLVRNINELLSVENNSPLSLIAKRNLQKMLG